MNSLLLYGNAERFWRKVSKTESGCWLWLGKQLATTRYGGFSVHVLSDRGLAWRSESAHRLSWEFVNGPIPTGLHVLHTCDVRHCVNPAHLRLGTHQDNMFDAAAKDRMRGGQRLLTPETVQAIREQYAVKREPHARLAKRHGVLIGTIRSVLGGARWRKVAGPLAISQKRFTLAHARVIRERRARGETLQVIATDYGTNKTHILRIVRGLVLKEP